MSTIEKVARVFGAVVAVFAGAAYIYLGGMTGDMVERFLAVVAGMFLAEVACGLIGSIWNKRRYFKALVLAIEDMLRIHKFLDEIKVGEYDRDASDRVCGEVLLERVKLLAAERDARNVRLDAMLSDLTALEARLMDTEAKLEEEQRTRKGFDSELRIALAQQVIAERALSKIAYGQTETPVRCSTEALQAIHDRGVQK